MTDEPTMAWRSCHDGEEVKCESCGRLLDWPGEIGLCYSCRIDEAEAES